MGGGEGGNHLYLIGVGLMKDHILSKIFEDIEPAYILYTCMYIFLKSTRSFYFDAGFHQCLVLSIGHVYTNDV